MIHANLQFLLYKSGLQESFSMQSYSFDIDSLPINVAICKKDGDDFIITGFNKSAEVTENILRNKLLGQKLTKLFPAVKEFGLFDLLSRVEASGEKEVLDTNFYEDDRISGWRRNTAIKLSDGTVAVFYEDRSSEKKLETYGLQLQKELLTQKNFLKTIVDIIPDLLWLKDTEGKYLACNAKFERLFGAKEAEIIGKDDFDFVDQESANFFLNKDHKVLEVKKSIIYEEVLTFADSGDEGLFETIKTPMKDGEGNIIGVLGIARDISERKAREEQLRIYANYDMLTGLANRTLFMDRLSHLMTLRKSNDYYSAVLFIDLDHFKEINDTFGHSTGDIILKLVSKRLQSVIRKGDTLSRHGGDEFTILLENINMPLDASKIAQNILNALKAPFTIEEDEFYITTSIGITIAPDDSNDPETLIRFADIAMYTAKENGRNSYTFYTQNLSTQAQERILLEHDLRNAIINHEFVLHYQPQINVLDKKIIGAEVLLRWNHPQKGMIMPFHFISIAESSGQIIDIGKWVIRQAMEDMREWKEDKLDIEMISINLSAKQLNDKALITIIEDSLETTGCHPECIEFEVTEGYAMSDQQAATSLLEEIHDLGCNISINNFGTGYSSLAYLKRLPIQKIKIDQSFVQDAPVNHNNEVVVSATILIAKSMNLDIIAEGVESTAQQEFLLKHGCILAQGYLYTKPLPKEEFETYLELFLS